MGKKSVVSEDDSIRERIDSFIDSIFSSVDREESNSLTREVTSAIYRRLTSRIEKEREELLNLIATHQHFEESYESALRAIQMTESAPVKPDLIQAIHDYFHSGDPMSENPKTDFR